MITNKARKPGLANIVLLYVFGAAISLYPLVAQFAQPVIVVSFLVILLVVLYNIFLLYRPFPNSQLFVVISVLTLVYVVWLCVAVLYDNDMAYALQDSLGFAIYLFITPVFFLFIRLNNLHQQLHCFLIQLSTLIAGLSLGIISWYYLSFGSIQSESLNAMNAFIKTLHLNWIIDNNAGFLGLYTYAAHFLLLGIGLAFYNYYIHNKKRYLYLMILFSFGVFADGHRALVVSLFLLLVLLLPLFKKKFSASKIVVVLTIVTVPMLWILVANIDWFLSRFNFSESDPSSMARYLQIPALLDKFTESPIMGNGFGSFASVIRSSERPFSYEVDFLATLMKLGLVGSMLYFGAYLYMLNMARRFGGDLGYILFCVGLSFLFYMGTNGGLAMSSDSAIFHMFLFVFISSSIIRVRIKLKQNILENKSKIFSLTQAMPAQNYKRSVSAELETKFD
jgi:hypothetical protein